MRFWRKLVCKVRGRHSLTHHGGRKEWGAYCKRCGVPLDGNGEPLYKKKKLIKIENKEVV